LFYLNLANGKLIIYSIHERSLIPVLEFDRKIENSMIKIPINKIVFNPIFRNIITISYEDGIVDMVNLSEDFHKNSYNDIEKLENDIIKLSNYK